MLGGEQRHVFEFRHRHDGGDVTVADLARRIGRVERRDAFPAFAVEIADRRQDEIAAADAGREHVAALGRRNHRRETVIDGSVREVERGRRLAQRAEGRAQDDRRVLGEDRLVNLERDCRTAGVIVKHEVHRPAWMPPCLFTISWST